MVGRAEPLVVNIFVAALAGIGLHEELAGNFLFAVNLRRTGEEISLRTVALAIHAFGRHLGILYSVARLPSLAHIMRAVADDGKGSKQSATRTAPATIFDPAPDSHRRRLLHQSATS